MKKKKGKKPLNFIVISTAVTLNWALALSI